LTHDFILTILFFFSSRRRHTRSKRDWSSDVCSSDLTNIVTIATGGSSGPYNIIATTLADGYSNEFGVNSRTETTGASAENLNLMKDEKAEMAFVMSDALVQAVNGEETFEEPIENVQQVGALYPNFVQDRKSTRLNSSHVSISYAVFCLKKKNTAIITNC